jgi:hypothetical protein
VTGETDLLGNPRRILSNAARRLNSQLNDMLDPLAAAAEAQEKIEASRIVRSASVPLAPAAVAEHLSTIRNWSAWSPWPGDDASLKVSYGGHQSGPGATCYWASRGKHGQISIISAGPEKVVVELEEPGPPVSDADLTFILAPDGNGTKVTLSVTGQAAERDVEQALTRLSAVLVKSTVNIASKGH